MNQSFHAVNNGNCISVQLRCFYVFFNSFDINKRPYSVVNGDDIIVWAILNDFDCIKNGFKASPAALNYFYIFMIVKLFYVGAESCYKS